MKNFGNERTGVLSVEDVVGHFENFFWGKISSGELSPSAKYAAAGIAGNLMQESGLRIDAPGGLAQWNERRYRAAGKTALEQLHQIERELEGPYRSVLRQLEHSKSPQEAARIFSEGFEKPGQPELPKREKYAAEAAGHHLKNLTEEGEAAVSKAAGGVLESTWKEVARLGLEGLLVLSGLVLVIYGIMVAVRPRERALSIPMRAAV